MVEIGTPPPAGGGLNKRTLLIGAVLIGGVAGAFILFTRKSNPSDTAENKAQTGVPTTSTDGLAYQNLAEQLLGFRGDVSVANANLQQGEQDILSAVGSESAARAASDTSLSTGLAALLTSLLGVKSDVAAVGTTVGSGFAGVNAGLGSGFAGINAGLESGFAGVNGNIASGNAVINGNLASGLAGVNANISNANTDAIARNAGLAGGLANLQSGIQSLQEGEAQIYGQNSSQYAKLSEGLWDVFARASDPYADVSANPWRPLVKEQTTGETIGAGGATPRDAILAAFGAEDDSHYYLAHMSSGPVRQVSKRTY